MAAWALSTGQDIEKSKLKMYFPEYRAAEATFEDIIDMEDDD